MKGLSTLTSSRAKQSMKGLTTI